MFKTTKRKKKKKLNTHNAYHFPILFINPYMLGWVWDVRSDSRWNVDLCPFVKMFLIILCNSLGCFSVPYTGLVRLYFYQCACKVAFEVEDILGPKTHGWWTYQNLFCLLVFSDSSWNFRNASIINMPEKIQSTKL